MEQVASLDLVQWDDDVLEENDVFFSQWHGETTDDTGQNIQKLGSSIELESLVDQGVETVVDGFTDHFSPWDEFSVKAVENVLEVLSFAGLL